MACRSQGSCRYYTLKSSCLKLSNLWAFECPCGAQETLKVVAKLVREKKKQKNDMSLSGANKGTAAAPVHPLSRLAVTLLGTAGDVMQHEQQHLCVCSHGGTSSSPVSLLPPPVGSACFDDTFNGSTLLFSFHRMHEAPELRPRKTWHHGPHPFVTSSEVCSSGVSKGRIWPSFNVYHNWPAGGTDTTNRSEVSFTLD